MFRNHFCGVNLQLHGIEDNLLCTLSDIQVDLHRSLVTVRASKLEIVERKGIIDGLYTNIQTSG